MKKAVIEESILKHMRRWHKTNIDEELMKARAYVAALLAYENSEEAKSDPEAMSLKDAEKIGTIWRTTTGRLQIQLNEN
ncbi:MAG: hypothetical protein P8M73_00490 [Luminiphilus sp.]|jgi:hypothetical protein|nr:hypothetical protein [Luminiphilus sp.]